MTRRPIRLALVTIAVGMAAGLGTRAQDRAAADGSRAAAPRIATTEHPAVPSRLSGYWLLPDSSAAQTGQRGDTVAARLARGVALIGAGDFEAGLPLVAAADLTPTPLASYGRFYAGVALLGLTRTAEADAVLTAVVEQAPEGPLREMAALRLAEVALTGSDLERAVEILDDLSEETPSAPEDVLLRLGQAHEAAGSRAEALAAYRRVYYEYPLSTRANEAQEGIERLQTPALVPPDRFDLELARAERLFAAQRWAQARAGFAPLARVAMGDERELVALRLAECDSYLGRHRAARDALRPLLDGSAREAEARFFHLTATRALRAYEAYVVLVRGLVRDHPDSRWAEDALNNLASHYVGLDDHVEADRVFRELARRFPRGRYADRAAWKIGWWAYKNGRLGEAADTFEAAAAGFPRADYRPSWLYWAGRARDRMDQSAAASALYRIVASDYFNSYYGRLAAALLTSRREPPVQPIVAAAPAPAPLIVPNEPVIRALIAAGLYDDALREVEYARRTWGDSPVLQATVAGIRHRRGFSNGATDRFADVRGAITMMRRAYPQFMAAGGEHLPTDVLRVIFPLDYWPLIKKYSDAHGLDEYLMTALVAQESTFTPDVRSAANAVGLMQLITPTARTVARKLGIRYSPRILTQPETNIRLGMKYFKDMVDQFGGAHYALAGYNAGPHRVVRWKAERPGFAQDEFIDDIPFPETQNYVKRILGTADDYRRLYGGGLLSTTTAAR
ncbi:MAG: tetratricopeptide repeat protein [Acidobacteria bacterium]|nr:tetratricopeptide repeat protein [Acidobacteriota bacterium]